jgi:hypothetical protein
MPLALSRFRKQGINAILSPCNGRTIAFEPSLSAILPHPAAALDIQQVIHEWLGLAWYKLNGRI